MSFNPRFHSYKKSSACVTRGLATPDGYRKRLVPGYVTYRATYERGGMPNDEAGVCPVMMGKIFVPLTHVHYLMVGNEMGAGVDSA